MTMKRLSRLRAALVLLFVCVAAGCEFVQDERSSSSNGSAPPGSVADAGTPDGTTPEVDGKPAHESSTADNSAHLVSAVQASDFQQKVLAHDQPVLVDFWAPWCGPCRSQAPILEKLASEMDGRVRIVKLNVDEPGNSTLAQKHGIKAIPTLLLFQDGKVVGRFVGLQQKETLAAALNKRL